MSLIRKIAGNTLVRALARLGGNIIGIVVVAMLTRYLGQEGFGHYTTILAYLFFFGALSDLGLYMITINELGLDGIDKDRLYSAIYSLRFYTGIALMLLAMGLIWFFPYPMVVKQGVLIVAISIFLGLLDQVQVAVYQSELRVTRISIGEFAGKVLLVIGVIIGIKAGVGLLTLLWAVVAGQALQWLISLTGLRRFLKVRLGFDRTYWKEIIGKTWPIAVSQLFVLIYFKMDTVFLSLLRPEELAQLEVGLYGAPYKILEVLIAFIPIFMGLVSPLLAKAWSDGGRERFVHMYQQAFDAFAIITWPLVLGGIMLASPIMDLLAPGFTGADKILQILMLAIGVIFFSHLPTYAVVAIGEQKAMLKAYGLAAGLAVILYISLIPVYSYYAAAWVTVFVELLVFVLAWLRVDKVVKLGTSWSLFYKSLFASLVMAVAIWLMDGWNLFAAVFIGCVVYFSFMWLIRGITREMAVKFIR